MDSKHRYILGGLFLVHGLIRAGFGILILGASVEFNFFGVMFTFALAAPALFGGYNLLAGNSSAHKIMPIAALVTLLDLPFGTAISIYYYWFWKYQCGSPNPFQKADTDYQTGLNPTTDASEDQQQKLHNELISRVSLLDGKHCEIEANRQTLNATIEALSECTSVDREKIESIADQLSVQSRFIESRPSPSSADSTAARITKYAKICAGGAVMLFCFTMFKWFHINNNIKDVMHEVASVQSRTADFYLRTGEYPYGFHKIGYDKAPSYKSVKHMKMGPNGELLIDVAGLFASQILLTPGANPDGLSQWSCTTNASWLFKVSGWLCRYQSSLKFSHIERRIS